MGCWAFYFGDIDEWATTERPELSDSKRIQGVCDYQVGGSGEANAGVLLGLGGGRDSSHFA